MTAMCFLSQRSDREAGATIFFVYIASYTFLNVVTKTLKSSSNYVLSFEPPAPIKPIVLRVNFFLLENIISFSAFVKEYRNGLV